MVFLFLVFKYVEFVTVIEFLVLLFGDGLANAGCIMETYEVLDYKGKNSNNVM